MRRSLKYKNRSLSYFHFKYKNNYNFIKVNQKIQIKRAAFVIFITSYIQFTIKQWYRTILFFKIFLRKPEKTGKRLWITPKYIINISRKSRGARMGVGRGRKLRSFLRLSPSTPLLEFFTRTGTLARRLQLGLQRRWHLIIILVGNGSLLTQLRDSIYYAQTINFYIK